MRRAEMDDDERAAVMGGNAVALFGLATEGWSDEAGADHRGGVRHRRGLRPPLPGRRLQRGRARPRRGRSSRERREVDARRATSRDADALAAAVDEAAAALGGLDVVVAAAGIAARGTVADTDPDDWDRVLAVNLRGVYLTGRAAIPHLRAAGGGAIVNIASQLGLVAAAGAAAYCASKGAVISLTRAMAIDHGPEGIRVNCVCPGPTDTPLLEPYFGGARRPGGRAAGPTRRCSCTARLVTAEEVADAVAYLAAPGSSSTMGAALVVDGGYIVR